MEQQTYNLLISVEGSGAVNVSPEAGVDGYQEGTEVTLTAVPDVGWEFTESLGEVTDNENLETTVVMENDKTVEAVFNEQEFADGSGTELEPFLVATAEQLNNVREYLDKNFMQIAEIDLSDYSE